MVRPTTLGALRLGRRLPSYAIAILLPLVLSSLPQDLVLILAAPVLVLLAPALVVGIVALMGCALAGKSRRQCLSVLGVFAVFVASSAAAFPHANAIRGRGRWLFWSEAYKAQVLASPAPPSRQLKHIEWDGWGMFGMDMTVYLVFDPTDQLLAGAMRDQPSRLAGIPCQVLQAHRLERCWYSVLFDVGEEWNNCNP
jgi:hypothetical protein